jgi:hypothetical protein
MAEQPGHVAEDVDRQMTLALQMGDEAVGVLVDVAVERHDHHRIDDDVVFQVDGAVGHGVCTFAAGG